MGDEASRSSADPPDPPERRAPVYRRAAATPRSARDLVFDRLPPAVRDRLTRCLAHGAPDALLAAPSGAAPLAQRAALAAAVVAGVAVLGLAMWELGDVRGKNAVQPASYAAVYGALLATAALASGAFAGIRGFLRGAPFRSGRYLLALDLVEAEGGRLRVTSLDTLRGVEARPRQVAIVFEDGHAIAFPAGKREDPTTLAAQVNRAVANARQLSYPADQAKLERLDPFFEVRMTEDWDAAAETRRGRDAARKGSRLGWLAAGALLAAAPAGIGLLRARNALSDDLMFEEARTRRAGDDVPRKLVAYAGKGVRHLDEVGRILVEEAGEDRTELRRLAYEGGPAGALAEDALFTLTRSDPQELSRYLQRVGPRADEADEALFAIARRVDTLASYSTYLEHGRRHADEVRNDLLPEADFAQAKRSDLVGSLLTFVRRHPGGKHDDEAWQMIRKVYAGALPAFEAAEHPSPEGTRFAEALLAALQDRADPRVTLDVQMGPATSVAAADAELATRYGRRYLPAAAHFSSASLGTLATDIRSTVGNWFGHAFPHGAVETARPSSEDEGRPRIEIRCDPVAYGSSQWHAKGQAEGEPSHVTPLVGFVVLVSAATPGREGKTTTLAWKLKLDDETDGKMQTKNFRGEQRALRDMLDDAFGHFFEGIPDRIAASFHGRL